MEKARIGNRMEETMTHSRILARIAIVGFGLIDYHCPSQW